MLYPPSSLGRIVCILAALCLAVAVGFRAVTRGVEVHPPTGAVGVPTRSGGSLLDQLARELAPALAESKHVLVGRRDPAGPSCIRHRLLTSQLKFTADPNGGPGMRLIRLEQKRPRLPKDTYRWSQTHLRSAVGRMRGRNAAAWPHARSVAKKARLLAALLTQGEDLPGRGEPVERPVPNTWPAYCMEKLLSAAAARDALGCHTWADELASALCRLDDLHRWLDLLLRNHLAALDFQARCEAAFTWADGLRPGGMPPLAAQLPTVFMRISRIYSYLEAERQAERMFQVPAEVVSAAAADNIHDETAALWLPPDLRKTFLAIRSRLSPPARQVWDKAASAPYERTYLANILHRVSRARTIDDVSVVLRRYERSHPNPTAAGLMGVLFHRAGFYSSGHRLGDRYDERLMRSAAAFCGPREDALLQAHAVANGFLGGWANYQGNVMTLKDALDKRKLDCIRGTDMIGALFRNAGQPDYCVIRLCSGTTGHSVGAATVRRDGRRRTVIVDSLLSRSGDVTWPDAYFKGMTWPQGYPGHVAPLFSAQLCARGLNGYLFAEGYVVRGPHAGELVRASLPYLPGRGKSSAAKVYPGPYPKLPPPALGGVAGR